MYLPALVCAVLFLPLSASAQTAVGPLTLEQVLELAEARSETIAIARAGIRRAEGERVRARSGLFPQLDVLVAYDRSLASEFEGVFDSVNFGAPQPGGEPAAQTRVSRSCRSAALNTWRLNLAVSQNLFTGGRIRAQRQLADGWTGDGADRVDHVPRAAPVRRDAGVLRRRAERPPRRHRRSDARPGDRHAAADRGRVPGRHAARVRGAARARQPRHAEPDPDSAARQPRSGAAPSEAAARLPADADIVLADALSNDVVGPPPPVFASRVLPIEAAIQVSDPKQVAADRTRRRRSIERR